MRIAMSEKRMRYDREFREGAVRIVEETKKPIAQVARDLGVNEGTLGNWVQRARAEREGRGVNPPGVSGDFESWEGWSYARRHAQAVPA